MRRNDIRHACDKNISRIFFYIAKKKAHLVSISSMELPLNSEDSLFPKYMDISVFLSNNITLHIAFYPTKKIEIIRYPEHEPRHLFQNIPREKEEKLKPEKIKPKLTGRSRWNRRNQSFRKKWRDSRKSWHINYWRSQNEIETESPNKQNGRGWVRKG